MKPKLYLCARVKPECHAINQRFIDLLSPYFDVFAPHLKEAELALPKNPKDIYRLDLDAMEKADVCFTIGPFGKDCAWEMGHFKGRNIPVFMYTRNILDVPNQDWMIAGALDALFTDNHMTFHANTGDHYFNYPTLYDAHLKLGKKIYEYFCSITLPRGI